METWRIFGISVHPDDQVQIEESKVKSKLKSSDLEEQATASSLLSIQERYVSPPLLASLYKRLGISKHNNKDASSLLKDVRVVRRSLDARKRQESPSFTYVVDIRVTRHSVPQLRLQVQSGRMERLDDHAATVRTQEIDDDASFKATSSEASDESSSLEKKKVVIVGAGPAGLFCALVLARSGLVTPIVLERGQPVESRGRDIGALMGHRRLLDSESNFAFGEGGAGTWSDGKLTTRIGRNSQSVRWVLETLVEYGAPQKILVEGSPHLGTDNLVRLLRNLRMDLKAMGGDIRFGTQMTKLDMEQGRVQGVHAVTSSRGQEEVTEDVISGDATVLATGHSARDVYERLYEAGVQLEPKGFAVGFRIEHPQKVINKIQYGQEWGPSVVTGKSRTDTANQEFFQGQETTTAHSGKLPVPSYRLATDKAKDGNGQTRGVYSFCMCPGGQIVPSSTEPEEVCVNGMSFSKRDSMWANSALVVTVSPEDEILDEYRKTHGVMAGLAFQRDMERKASKLGGGNLTVPVQRMTDFVKGQVSATVPSSSYRLGVKSAPCHEIYPAPLTEALRDALVNYFDRSMPGYYNEEGLLHAVETRTSSPLRVSRDSESLTAIGIENLFPAGEGAGFAGGIVSAAVDGMAVAEAVLDQLYGENREGRSEEQLKSVGFSY
jgi:uncharacterized FAD-dependent dehydrogenase